MSNSIHEEWSRLSLLVANDPDNFQNWENLVHLVSQDLSKVSSQERLKLFRITNDQFLLRYPLLEQYWIKYAQLEFMLGFTENARYLYEKALTILPSSNLVWLSYLSFIELVEVNYVKAIKYYKQAATTVGFHYHSYEFWQSYLDFEERNNGKSLFYYNLLKKILEVPIFNYSYFFKLFFSEIDSLDKKMIVKVVSDIELQKKLKVDPSKDLNLHDLKAKLKKIYTEVYITTQFKVFELFNYEKHIKLEYYVPGLMKSYQEISNWERYLSFAEINGFHSQVQQLYERCLIPMASYPQFWVKYADYFIKLNQLQNAKNVLYRSLAVLSSSDSILVHLKLIKLEIALNNFLKAKDLALTILALEESIELFLQSLNVEYLLTISDISSFKNMILSIIMDKRLDVASPILRHTERFKKLKIDVKDLDFINKDGKFNNDDGYWLLYLNKLIEGGYRRSVILKTYKGALNAIGSSERLIKWFEDNFTYELDDSDLLIQFNNSSQMLFNIK